MKKLIEGFKFPYYVDEDSSVTGGKYARTMKMGMSFGYKTVHLSMGKYSKSQFIHRLLAHAFIPNPHNLPMVNHINGDRLDNRLENLEWVTASYNVKDGFNRGRVHPQQGKRYVDRKRVCERCKRVFEYVKPQQRFCGKRCAGINNLKVIALDDTKELS